MGEQRRRNALRTEAEPTEDTGRTLWVVAVMAFWLSAGITLAVLLITGGPNLILVSITVGMMVLGVWLKARYQWRRRKAPHRAAD